MSRVALVSGSNKGIGLAIVELLCKNKPNWAVYLTARDEGRGKAAVKQLNDKGLKPEFHKLDINDVSSIEKLRDFLVSKHGGLDVLVNNAAISFHNDSTVPLGEQAKVMAETNYFNLWKTCDVLYPILKPHARVVIMASRGANWLLSGCSDELKSIILDKSMTRDGLDAVMNRFIRAAEKDQLETDGWPICMNKSNTAYCNSKMGPLCMTFIQQKAFDKDPREDLVVNACCPGLVATDLNQKRGVSTLLGADTPFFLATLPEGPSAPRGGFFAERQPHAWDEKPFQVPEEMLKLFMGAPGQ